MSRTGRQYRAMRRMVRCAVTGKVRYPKLGAALARLATLLGQKRIGDHRRAECRAYRCVHCGGVHLTSKPLRAG